MASGGTLSLPRNATTSVVGGKRERFQKTMEGMKAARQPYEAEIYEIASLAQPNRSRQVCEFGNNGRGVKRRGNRLYDGHAIRSFRYLTSGMYSGMSSPNRPWFAFELPDRDLMQYQPVKVWLSASAKIIARMLATSNFYGAVKTGYGELGLFGTDACIMTEGLDHETGLTYPVCYPQTFGEYWLGVNEKNEPDRLSRKSYMTIRQMVQSFVADPLDPRRLDWSKVSQSVVNGWDKGNYDDEVPVYQMIEPNMQHVPGRLDTAGKPWLSHKWEEGQSRGDVMLEERGFHSQPFWAPRWDITNGGIYGYGTGHEALPDMRDAQLQAKRKGEATDYAVKPPLVAPSSMRVKFQPGSVTYASAADMGKVQTLFEVDYRAIQAIGADLKDSHDNIDEATYARLFMAISNLEGSADRTVAEIAAREEEKLTQLGPVIERVNNEKLAIAIDRAFDIAARNGLLPPPPEELGGMPIEIDFTSILAQAQKMVGMNQTERALGFVANLEKLAPGRGAMDNINTDALVSDIWERSGASPEALMDPRERDEKRAAAQQAAQAQQAAERMASMKDGSEAVKNMAETPVQGGEASLFDKMIGAQGGA